MITTCKHETVTHINVAPAKPCTKPEEEISIEVYAGWVGDLTWISRSDRGVPHAFSCTYAIRISVLPWVENMTPFAMLKISALGMGRYIF